MALAYGASSAFIVIRHHRMDGMNASRIIAATARNMPLALPLLPLFLPLLIKHLCWRMASITDARRSPLHHTHRARAPHAYALPATHCLLFTTTPRCLAHAYRRTLHAHLHAYFCTTHARTAHAHTHLPLHSRAAHLHIRTWRAAALLTCARLPLAHAPLPHTASSNGCGKWLDAVANHKIISCRRRRRCGALDKQW